MFENFCLEGPLSLCVPHEIACIVCEVEIVMLQYVSVLVQSPELIVSNCSSFSVFEENKMRIWTT